MDVGWHNHVTHYFEVILLASFFEDLQEGVAGFGGIEDRAFAEAVEVDGVEVSGLLVAAESGGHSGSVSRRAPRIGAKPKRVAHPLPFLAKDGVSRSDRTWFRVAMRLVEGERSFATANDTPPFRMKPERMGHPALVNLRRR